MNEAKQPVRDWRTGKILSKGLSQAYCSLSEVSPMSERGQIDERTERKNDIKNKINIETRRSTTPEKRVILVQGPC